MAKTKDTSVEDLNNTLREILEELGNISYELSEINSGLSTIGTMVTINMIVDKRPELKDKVAPLINELIENMAIAFSDIDKETPDEE
jgi:hypothetical protein